MKNESSFLYRTEVTWLFGRNGRLHTANLPAFCVSAPPEFQGDSRLWTPEHLYIASVNACFLITFAAIATGSKLDIASFSVSAEGKLEKVAGGDFQITEIVLKPRLVVRAARDLDRASRIMEKAEKSCFITNSIKTVVKLEPQIYHEQLPAYPCPAVPEVEKFALPVL